MANNSPLKPGQIGGLKTRKAGDKRDNPTMMIYGSGGAGKTGLAASACEVPEMCPVLHLNLEQGAQTIEHLYPQGDIDIIDITNFKDFQAVFQELHSTGGAGYNTVILDNATEAQQMGIEYIMGTAGDQTDFTEFDGPTFANGGYNRSSEQMRKVIRYFRGLPLTTIITAWARDYSATAVPDWKPAFTKTFGGEAPGLVNDLYYYTVNKNGVRELRTRKTNTIEAKDRTGTLPELIRNPTMKIIHDYWTGKTVKSEEPAQEDKPKSTLNRKKA